MSDLTRSKQEIIVDYMREHSEPIQSKCPIIVQKWATTKNGCVDGHVFWNSDTGKRTKTFNEQKCEKESNGRFKTWYTLRGTSSFGYDLVYTNYIPEYEMIQLGVVHLSGNRHKDGEKEEWTWGGNAYDNTNQIIFLFKGDINPYNKRGELWHPEAMGKFYNKDLMDWFKALKYYKTIPLCQTEFESFVGIQNYQVNSWTTGLSCPYCWSVWYKQSAPRKTSKHQLEINTVEENKLTPLKDLQQKYPLVKSYEDVRDWRGNIHQDWVIKKLHYVHFEIINDKMCVLRLLERKQSNPNQLENYSHPEFTENIRIYITDKGKVTVTLYSATAQQFQIQSASVSSFMNYYTKQNTAFDNLEDIKKWTRLSWIYDILAELQTTNFDGYYSCTTLPELIVMLLRHPILEKMYKAGYKNLTRVIMRGNTISANLKSYFGITETNKGSITKILGCNKDMLKWINDNCIELRNYEYPGRTYYNIKQEVLFVPAALKEIFANQDLSTWSKESVDTFCDPMLQTITAAGSNWRYYMLPECDSYHYYYRYRQADDVTPLTEKEQAICIHYLKMAKKNPEILRAYIDTTRMYRNLRNENRPEINSLYKMNNIEDIQNFHNALTELYNQQQAEMRAYWDKQTKERLELDKKKFEKLQEERREQYNFETLEDKYIVKVPEALAELTTEGQTLHHCVGGYLHSHAVGETNIMFLRDKATPSVPFFTIEVKNNVVVQIHGRGNAWIGSDKNAKSIITFLIKWLRTKGIHCASTILLCKSTNYSSGSEYLDGTEFGL